jgi:PKD repeat protein
LKRSACCLLAPVLLGLSISAAGQSFTFTPTTTLATESGNNTSAANSFTAQTNGNAGAGNTSKLPTRNLLYSGSATQIYAHFMPWFGQSNHISVGYNSDDATQVKKQVDDMMSRGIQGAVIDWYGPNFTVENGTTLVMKSEAESRGGQFVFAVMEDVGALNSCAKTSGCSVTQQIVSDLTYAYNTYETSPAYMTNNGHPLVYFFGVDQYTIDWNAVRQSVPGNPYFIFQGSSGFTHAQSNGSFSWISVNTSNSDDEGLAYLDSFYNTAQSYPSDLTVGSAYAGFNNSLAPWLGTNSAKVMKQHCGQTWMDTLGKTGNHYSTTNQLYAIQLVTWNDYEEGTEIESGIDNCIAVGAATSGSTLTWSLTGSGKENTIDHYTVFISNDGQNLMSLGNVASGTHTYDISKLGLAPGSTWQFYVKAIGVPSIHNQTSSAVAYAVPANQPPVASLTVAPLSGTAPLAVTADASGSHDPDGTIVSYSINFGDGTTVSAATATHTYSLAGSFKVTATVTDNGGASSSASQTVTVSAPSTTCTPGTVNRTITICKPAAGATVSSPVNVVAAATDNRAVQNMAVLVDGVKKYQQGSTKQINTSIAISSGTHTVTVQAKDSIGTFNQSVSIKVQ